MPQHVTIKPNPQSPSAVADLASALTARLPHLRVLATSREPLWDGEVTYRLAPLAVVGPGASLEELSASAAVRLFRERAGARARGALDTERACRLFAEISDGKIVRFDRYVDSATLNPLIGA